MAEDDTVYYPVTTREIIDAYWLDCEKTRVAIVPYPERPGSMQVASSYPPLVDWIKQGNEIRSPHYDCLGYAKRKKIYEIEKYAQQLLEENEPGYRRKFRHSRMMMTNERMPRDLNYAVYDESVLRYTAMQCGRISLMMDINEVIAIDTHRLSWPSNQLGDK